MFQYFTHFTLFLGLIPLVLYLKNKKLISVETFAVFPFIVLLALSSLYEFVFSYLLEIKPNYWFRFYLLLEFFALVYFYHSILPVRKKAILFSVAYLLLYGYFLVHWNVQVSYQQDSYLSLVEFLMIFLFSIAWFKSLFNSNQLIKLTESSLFYFVTGFFLYFSGTLFLFLMSNLLFKKEAVDSSDFWRLNVVLSFVLRILLIVGIWIRPQK